MQMLQGRICHGTDASEYLTRCHSCDHAHVCLQESLANLRREKDKEISRLEASVSDYERKARGVAEYQEKKDLFEAELISLKETLQKRVKDYEAELT